MRRTLGVGRRAPLFDFMVRGNPAIPRLIVLKIGGFSDQVHALVFLPPTTAKANWLRRRIYRVPEQVRWAVPTGLESICTADPALKRWAKLGCPSGTLGSIFPL